MRITRINNKTFRVYQKTSRTSRPRANNPSVLGHTNGMSASRRGGGGEGGGGGGGGSERSSIVFHCLLLKIDASQTSRLGTVGTRSASARRLANASGVRSGRTGINLRLQMQHVMFRIVAMLANFRHAACVRRNMTNNVRSRHQSYKLD